eukprot:Skav235458  [mRNA]  locus=scaffold2803:11858:16510:- [translate_table: standard]
MAESSHTRKALPAVLSEYRASGFRLSLTDPVPDRFAVSDESGSYRGLSRGVAVASKFPLFSPRPKQIPDLAWQSQRLLLSVVQMGQVPVHLVVVYLHPNPAPGSFRHKLNSQLLDWAWSILSEISGPACLIGDFNSPWQSYDVAEALVAGGWVDLHALWAERKGEIPQPTCKQATRHTFILSNPAFTPFVTNVWVDFEDSLDSHSVLLASVTCATCNPMVWKWPLPQALDQCTFDPRLSWEAPSQEWLDRFRQMLQNKDVSQAFQTWSESTEQVLVKAASLNDEPVGPTSTPSAKGVGCTQVELWRQSFPLLESNRDVIPDFTWAHGLWEEPPLLRTWQAHLDSLQLPEVDRAPCVEPVYLYSDGACLRPRCKHASLAAAAVIRAQSDGTYQVVWHGRLPGSLQSPFWAELLAGSIAFASHRAVHLYSDCLAFVKCAKRLLLASQEGVRPVLPQRHLDLWTYFWISLQGADSSQCSVTWVPAHRDYRLQQGMARVHSWFNGCVDKVAREGARSAICPLFSGLASQVDLLRQAAVQLATFQAGVAKLFANEDFTFSPRSSTFSSELVPLAPLQLPSAFHPDLSAVPCPTFARDLASWLGTLQWTASARDPASDILWTDTSFLELFWAFVWSTGVLPPFRHDGIWVLPQDDPLLAFVQPSFCVLFRSWKRQLDILVRLGFVPCWTSVCPSVSSAGHLGASFACPGVIGRAILPHECLMSLASALQCVRRLSALSLPVTVN